MVTKQLSGVDSWMVLEDILKKEGIARQHLNSYNEFIERGIQNIIDEMRGIEVESLGNPYKVKFGKIRLGSARVVEIDGSVSTVLPLESRLRTLAYHAPIHLEMIVEESGVIRETQSQHVGDLPVMVRSDLCVTSRMTKEQLTEICTQLRCIWIAHKNGEWIVENEEKLLDAIKAIEQERIELFLMQKNASKEAP